MWQDRPRLSVLFVSLGLFGERERERMDEENEIGFIPNREYNIEMPLYSTSL